MSDIPGGVNPLDFLHKLSMQRSLPPPIFTQFAEQGPAHMKTFVWSCSFNGLNAEGMGRSKKEAKIAAAKALKEQLNLEALPPVSQKKKRVGRPEMTPPPPSKKKMKKEFPPRQFPMGGFFPMPGPMDVLNGASADPADFMNPHFGGFYSDESNEHMILGTDPFSPNFYGGPQQNFIPASSGSVFCSRLSKLDRLVIRKHKLIYPEDTELSFVLQLVKDTEEAMRLISEELNSDGEKIKGMGRVGDLAKGLLLKTTQQVELVLMCQDPPTSAFLKTVIAALTKKIKESYPDKSYQVVTSADDGGFSVAATANEGADCYYCNVTLTSVALRKKNLEEVKKEPTDGDEESSEDVKPLMETTVITKIVEEPDYPDQLPRERCMKALAELRHARWFSSMAAGMPSCIECIRIMKDLAMRDPAWGILTPWAVELLVERSLFSALMPLNPAASIMRIMEVVASGLFLDNVHGLKDPCEHESIDVIGHLTKQERENLTFSAQQYLRMMHFRQICKVLDMPEEEQQFRDRHPVDSGEKSEEKIKTENGST